MEGSGTVAEVGARVAGLEPGQRVAFLMAPGAYAERVAVPAGAVVAVPDDIELDVAAAILLQGVTALTLVSDGYPVGAGSTVVVRAAAGGTGSLVCQLAAARGATVIGVVGDRGKAVAAHHAGAVRVVVAADGVAAPSVLDLTGHRGADVVYDANGRDTFSDSLECLAVGGKLVLFGQASGPPPALDPLELSGRSLSVGFCKLSSFNPTPERMRARASELFEQLREGTLRAEISRVYPLAEAAEAHRAMESRQTVGKLLLEV
jgi:NADPH2:quinone reductase